MTRFFGRFAVPAVLLTSVAWVGGALAQPLARDDVPAPLQPWTAWATWHAHPDCPVPYHAADQPICFWPSRLSLSAQPQSGSWDADVAVYHETWIPLPGSSDLWPTNVMANSEPVAVLSRDGTPWVRLPAGTHRLTGEFLWNPLPQKISIPPQFGLLALSIGDQEIAMPTWDSDGNLWLRRDRTEATTEQSLSVAVYRVIEDGIPLWLHTELELAASGKSREEVLGTVLPAGWTLSHITSPLPLAIDTTGQAKVQVRAGTWKIELHAFRSTSDSRIEYAQDAQPVADRELIGLLAQPEFRLAEITGLQTVDVSQTTFPQQWRHLPVYQWDPTTPFEIEEKLRGMGLQQPDGLTIQRQFWLDEDGRALTYHDHITGTAQQVWRLDAAPGHTLGAVRSEGEGQLITANPQTQDRGVEIRSRQLNLEAVGRIDSTSDLPATGWQADAANLHWTLTLPPGWRVFAVLGADYVTGDWLTAWTLLDLFLLLIFALSVGRMLGAPAALLALLAFGLAYHEPAAPRWTWFFLLAPLALLKVVPDGKLQRLIAAWKYVAMMTLAICLFPFVTRQVQQVIYPQLEPAGSVYRAHGARPAQAGLAMESWDSERLPSVRRDAVRERGVAVPEAAPRTPRARYSASNLAYDPQAKIQTGPAQPQWNWNQVECYWNGPVAASQVIRPILISLPVHRGLTLLRIALLLGLVAILIRSRWTKAAGPRGASVAVLAITLATSSPAAAQFPDPQMLDTLRERLLEADDAFPEAASIALAEIEVRQDQVRTVTHVHTATRVAVPLPGSLAAWSPVSVTQDGQPNQVICRRDGYLWVVVEPGVHVLETRGLMPDNNQWEWTFRLPPHRVTIDAPGWKITGVSTSGIPEEQVFFAREQPASAGTLAYDRRDFETILAVDRHLEIGLRWRVHTEVTRLSPAKKAVSVAVPLLPQERVLSSAEVRGDGAVDVILSADQQSFAWESELPVGEPIALQAAQTSKFVERWHLVTSPVWNVAIDGLAAVYEAGQAKLVPVWHPWPGESSTLTFSKPQPIAGETITIQQVDHQLELGSRQRTTQLGLQLQCSLGDDFPITLPADAQVAKLTSNGQSVPVRMRGAQLLVPVRPGKQTLLVDWKSNQALQFRSTSGTIELPVDAANVNTQVGVPESRWVLWAEGPLRGPAVRFWTLLACALLVALILGSLKNSPLQRWEWILLSLGLTQVPLAASTIVVGWLFLLVWRGTDRAQQMRWSAFDGLQLLLVLLTVAALCVLVAVVAEGLLGNPKMFIVGNGSHVTSLRWFAPRPGTQLPVVSVWSVSVWYYRLLMLVWALWLAAALLSWLKWGWQQFSTGGYWKLRPKIKEPGN
jgi:hypothetical protein